MSQATTQRGKKDQFPPLWGREPETGDLIQPSVEAIIHGVEARGARLWLDDGYKLRAKLPKRNLQQLKKLLKQYRASVFHYLLGQRPKIVIPVACRCAEKPYAHLTHDPPRGVDEAVILLKGDLRQFSEVLAQCQAQGPDWTMVDLIMRMEDVV